VAVASETSGLVAEVLADKGDFVRAGQLLVRLDDGWIRAQLREADSAVETAEANLRVAQSGPRQSQIDAAQAALSQAHAYWLGAWQEVLDAQQELDNPLDLEARVHEAQSRVALADRGIEQAMARQATARVLRERVAGDGSDQGKTLYAVYDKQFAAAGESIAAAQAAAQGARHALELCEEMRDKPVAQIVQLQAAKGNLTLATAQIKVGQAILDLTAAGPRPAEVAMAEAQLRQAVAKRDLLHIQAGKVLVVSPIEGVVIARAVHPGELAVAGAPLLLVTNLQQVDLVLYIPEASIGQVQVGQQAKVQVDAYPNRTFSGAVSYISPRAEYTPKNTQIPEERVKTVFAVKITLENGDGALKPGMPADAVLAPP
jgi:HlyD family secretion protein